MNMADNRLKGLESKALFLFLIYVILSMRNFKLYTIYSSIPFVAILVGSLIILLGYRFAFIHNFGFMLSMLIYDAIAVILNGGGWGSVMIQVYLALLIICFSNSFIDRWMLRALLLCAFFWLAEGVLHGIFKFDVLLGINTNTISELVYFSTALIISLRRFFKWKLLNKRGFCLVLSLLSLVVIYQEQSRMTLLVELVFLVACFFIPRNLWTRKLINAVTISICIGGLLFPIVYLGFTNNQWLNALFYRYTGKYLYTGREIIWGTFLGGYGDSWKAWLIGLGSKSTSSAVSTDFGTVLHNSYLLLLLNFGLIGLLLFIAYIVKSVDSIMKQKNGNRIEDYQLECIFAFWGFLLIGWSETVLLWQVMMPLCFFTVGIAQNPYLKRFMRT